MPRTHRCNLLTLAAPYGTETRIIPCIPPIVSYDDGRVMRALAQTKLQATQLVVGDGTFRAYADVHSCIGGVIALGTFVAGRFEPSKRLYALALAQDIVQRMCGVKCTAMAICCESGGVRFVPVPAEYLQAAQRSV